MAPTVALITLGCAKNQVDMEGIAGLMEASGFQLVRDPAHAQYIVINTCCFVGPAQEESVDEILQAAKYKEDKCRFLAVVGCLVERFGTKMKKLIPEVDLWMGTGDYHQLPELMLHPERASDRLLTGSRGWFLDERATRRRSTPAGWTYLKIAEGCDNRCSYCVIPSVRGDFRSRPIEGIIREVRSLIDDGVKEINLIAQDTTSYGKDLPGDLNFAKLLMELDKLQGDFWLRILYGYPSQISDELLQVMAGSAHILHYLDIPLQHIHPRVLRAMGRESSAKRVEEIVQKIRQALPDSVIRTTLITGFPGETEEEFLAVIDFIQKYKLDWVGVFPYSREEGTPAAALRPQVHGATRRRRARRIMETQAWITAEILQKQVDKELRVLVEEANESEGWGRSYRDAPEIDGKVYFKGKSRPGEFVWVKITEVLPPYDLQGYVTEFEQDVKRSSSVIVEKVRTTKN